MSNEPERRIPVARPCFGPEEEKLVREVIRSGWVTQGPRVAAFEERFAEATGAAEAVAVSSCTTGLFLGLHALGIGPGDEVVVPSLSFVASAHAVAHCGAGPVFADVDPRTYDLDPDSVREAIGPFTRALLVVHQLGLPADLDRLEALAEEHGLLLIEDAACALGARHRGRPIGGAGHLACFSFHPRKIIVTGEGGMITTDDRDLAARLRRLRHQGMSVSDLERHRASGPVIESYDEVGFNFRMSDLHAALGLVQLGRLGGFLAERRAIAERYERALSDHALDLPFAPTYAEPSFQSYIVRARDFDEADRNALLEELQRRGVASRRGLMASHRERCYADARHVALPHSERAADQTFLLPIYNGFGEDEQSFVVEQLGAALDAVSRRKRS